MQNRAWELDMQIYSMLLAKQKRDGELNVL